MQSRNRARQKGKFWLWFYKTSSNRLSLQSHPTSVIGRASSVSCCQIPEIVHYRTNTDDQQGKPLSQNTKFYFWVLKVLRGMYKVYNQAVSITNYWVLARYPES